MLDPTTLAAYRAAQTAPARAQAVRDSLGSGTLTVELREGASLVYSGTFSGPMTAGADGSLSASAQLSGLVTTAGTPNAATWTCRIANGSGRYIEGSFGPGGRFTWSQGALVVGDVVRLDVSIAAAGGAWPAWRQGMAAMQWKELTDSAMSLTPPTVDPGRDSGGPSAKMNAWCGLAIDQRVSKVWSPANGGHDDYHGNEVMSFDLLASAPSWVETLPSSSGFTVPSDTDYYSDGTPVSAHSYYTLQCIESRDRVIRFGVGAAATSGNPKPVVDGFDSTGVGNWDAPGTYPSVPSGYLRTTVKDPSTEDVYGFVNNYSVQKWANATNTWSAVQNEYPPVDFEQAAAAFDSNRSRIFLLKGIGDARHIFDPATGLFTQITLTGPASSAVSGLSVGAGMIFVPTLDAYLVRGGLAGGGAVFKIDAGSFECTELSTAGDSTIQAVAVISGSPENVWSRWLYAPGLNGAVFFPRYDSNAWFLALE